MTNAVRRIAARIYHAATAVRPSPAPDGGGPPVVVGFLRSPSGIGESARLCHAGLARLGLRPGHVDVSHRFQPHRMLDRFVAPEDRADGRGPLILHVNPPELPAVTGFLGRRLMRHRRVIGYWAWELEDLPPGWSRGARFVHEAWVPSRFVAEAVRRRIDRPVRVVPHLLEATPATPRRAAFGIDDGAFAVLAVADARSSLTRKNLAGVLAAFRAARRPGERWRLVLKLGGGATPRERAVFGLDDDPDVAVVDRTLSGDAMADLFASADAVLSLHRSEGFGLVPAMALLHGRPLVSTEGTGCADFLTTDVYLPVPGRWVPVDDPQGIYRHGRWLDPDIDSAAAHLRRLRADPELRADLGRRARLHAGRFFALDRWRDSLGDDVLADADFGETGAVLAARRNA